jgi:hypothetical protein
VPHLAGSKQNSMRATTFLSAVFLLLSATTYGQFKKGSTLLGGDISFNTSKVEDLINASESKSSAFTFSPVFAKAIKDNLFFGGSLSFGSSKSTYNTNGEAKGETYYASLFLRKYKPVFGKFNAFLQAGINVGRLVSETEEGPDYNRASKAFTTFASLTPGVSIGVSKKLYLEAGFNNLLSLGYTNEKITGYNFGNNIDRKSSSFGFSSSLSTEQAGLFFGVRFILPR